MRGKFSFFFFQNRKPLEMKNNVFYVVAFDPIKIQESQAPQNICLNPLFVKDMNVVGKKRPEMVVKWPTLRAVSFLVQQSIMMKIDRIISYFIILIHQKMTATISRTLVLVVHKKALLLNNSFSSSKVSKYSKAVNIILSVSDRYFRKIGLMKKISMGITF